MKIHTEGIPIVPRGAPVAIDTEFFGQDEKRLHRPHGKFACLSVAYGKDVYQYYTVTTARNVLTKLRRATWVGHNLAYDITQLRGIGVEVPRRAVWDTLLVDRVLWNGYYETFSLDDLTRRYLDVKLKKEVRSTFADAEGILTKEQKQYAAFDAKYTLQVQKKQEEILTSELAKVYWEIDEPALWAVLDMKPVKVDTKIWRGLVKEFKEKAAEIEERLGFNVFSHKTVLSRLADLGFHLQNTAAETLEEYRTQHPIFDEIITCRSYRTAVSRYGMNWLDNYLEDGDLMYASWKVTGAETGRMACSKPPLQQVPVRNEELGMDRYRTAFISAHPKGSMLVSDVSMQEPRITAYASQDENLLAAAKSGEDIHQYVTDQLSGALKKKVSRKLGKDVNLGMVYGLSPYGLARNVGISEDEARELMGIYFNRFPGVVSWAAWTKNRALSKGFVETPAGRRFWINPHNSQWERNAVNSPIQGGAADHTKLTLSKIWKECRRQGIEFPVSMVIHDEIDCDLPPGVIRTYSKILKDAWLEAAGELFPGVPFVVDIAHGSSWGCK